MGALEEVETQGKCVHVIAAQDDQGPNEERTLLKAITNSSPGGRIMGLVVLYERIDFQRLLNDFGWTL